MLRSPSRSFSLRRRLPLRFETLETRLAPAIFTVTDTGDSGTGTLRQAIIDANNASGPDEIHCSVTGTITLSTGQLVIDDDVTIVGPGSGNLSVSGGFASRIFFADDDSNSAIHISISGMSLTQGTGNDQQFQSGGAS